MIYSRLTNEELERRVYIDPTNAEAQAELLTRVDGMIENNDADLEEANQDNVTLRKEIDEKDEEIGTLDDALSASLSKVADLEDRIAELTHAGDLV